MRISIVALYSLMFGLSLTACGADEDVTPSAGAAASDFDGQFLVTDDLGGEFSHQSPRPRARFVGDSTVDVSAGRHQIRVSVDGLPETGAGRTTDFNRNNTMYTTRIEVDGQSVWVGCDPADVVQGWFERTELTEATISGEFEFEVIRCGDYFSDEEVAVPQLPFRVRASFQNLPLTE